MLGRTGEDETQYCHHSLHITRLWGDPWVGNGCHCGPRHLCCHTIFSSQLPGLAEQRALLLLAEESGGRTVNDFSSGSSAEVGQGRMLGGGVSGPGLSPRSQSCPKVCGVSGVLTKSGIGSELQDFLILWGKKALRGARPLLPTPPIPHNLDFVVRMGSIQGGHEADHLPPWVWGVLRTLGVIGLWDKALLGQALTSIPCPRSSFSTWLHSNLNFTEDWRGRPYISQTGPPHPTMLGGLLREGQPCDQSHNMLG